jgi:hypothetical protein
MVKLTKVEFSEGTYKTLWTAIHKTGDEDLMRFFKEQAHKETEPVLHYYMIKEYLFGFLDAITKAKVEIDINMVLHNCRKNGYHGQYHVI